MIDQKPSWSLYQNRPSFALGFHGTDQRVADGVISGGTHLIRSENTYYASSGNMPPVNSGGPDLLKRALDCEVIEALHGYRYQRGLPSYDAVRAPFLEDSPLYPGAGFRARNHIQIAVRNIACIKGYFRPIQDAGPWGV